MMRALAACALLAGCSPIAPPPPGDAASDRTDERATLDRTYAGPESLVGEWRVAGVDNRSVNLGWAITASIDAGTIRIASQCVTPSWTYVYARPKLQTRPVPMPICERGRAPAEDIVIAVLDAGGTVERDPSGGVTISGGGHSVTLYSQ